MNSFIPVGPFPNASVFFKLFASQELEEICSHFSSMMTLVVYWVSKHSRSHSEGGLCHCLHILSHILGLIFFLHSLWLLNIKHSYVSCDNIWSMTDLKYYDIPIILQWNWNPHHSMTLWTWQHVSQHIPWVCSDAEVNYPPTGSCIETPQYKYIQKCLMRITNNCAYGLYVFYTLFFVISECTISPKTKS